MSNVQKPFYNIVFHKNFLLNDIIFICDKNIICELREFVVFMKKYMTAVIVILVLISFKVSDTQAATKLFYESSNAPQLTVVNFHHFGEASTYPQIDNIRTDPQRFRELLAGLKKNGYTTITQKQAIAYLKGTGRIPKKSILLTIDDGYESTYTYAYPILKEMGMVATLYPIISDIELGNRMDVPTATWDQLAEMAKSGHIEIGNHTYDLHWRERVGLEAMVISVTKDQLRLTTATRKRYIMDDTLKAEAVFKEHTGLQMGKTFSFPYGAYDKVAIQTVKDLGYEAAYTVNTGYNLFGSGADNMYEIKRIGIANKTTSTQLLSYLTRNTTAAQNEINKRELRVSTTFNQKKNQLRIVTQSTKGTKNIKNIQFEVYRNYNGERTKVGNASVARATAYNSKNAYTFTEDFTKTKAYRQYGKGNYSMKIIMTNTKGQRFIEWINYSYK